MTVSPGSNTPARAVLADHASVVHATPAMEDALRRHLRQASALPFHRERIDPSIFERDGGLTGFGTVPFTSKEEVLRAQSDAPPFGPSLGASRSELRRVYSSGGLFVPMTGADLDAVVGTYARAWRDIGIGEADVVDIASTYHWALGGTVLDESFRSVGAAVVPGGPGQSADRLRVMQRLGVTVLQAFTPYVEHLAHIAAEEGYDPARDFDLRLLIIGGELRDAAAKERLAQLWGSARAVEVYGTAEAGLVAVECPEHANGMHVLDGSLVEIVDPDSGEPVDAAGGGEVVITELHRTAQPWIRCRTGDIVEGVDRQPCPCGRTTPRLGRIVARRSNMLRVRGSFVDVGVLISLAARTGRCVASTVEVRRDGSTDDLIIEVSAVGDPSDDECRLEEVRVAEAVRATTGVRCTVRCSRGPAATELTVIDARDGTRRRVPLPAPAP